MVLPHVIEFNSEEAPEKIQRIFSSLGYIEKNRVEEMPDKQSFIKLEKLIEGTGLGIKLSEQGFKESHFDDIASGTLKSFQTLNNPRTVTREDIVGIVKRLI
jgi:alcohol dehydrogenase class IV